MTACEHANYTPQRFADYSDNAKSKKHGNPTGIHFELALDFGHLLSYIGSKAYHAGKKPRSK